MMFKILTITALAASLFHFACAVPSGMDLESRASNDNIVYVTDEKKFCMIMPRDFRTKIGDSEHPGGMKTYCSPDGRYDNALQGQLPDDFWRKVAFKKGNAPGKRFAQLTGCIKAWRLSRLNLQDQGGQYSSSGNPKGSKCLGYKHYVELVEPAQNRACIKCCDDPKDCPTNLPTKGCPAVIKGDYFDCN
ncbi:hypothetical protein DL96DRAFT_1526488 [Flagelloscypha sp. PMI_526]|nr:hypothetical protein DL96DRAFT_1526488 [Flagelloscypha sp. PMI_526]